MELAVLGLLGFVVLVYERICRQERSHCALRHMQLDSRVSRRHCDEAGCSSPVIQPSAAAQGLDKAQTSQAVGSPEHLKTLKDDMRP